MTTQEEWEKEFDKEFWPALEFPECAGDVTPKVKKFIHTLRSQAFQEGREEALSQALEAFEKIETMPLPSFRLEVLEVIYNLRKVENK